jgi:two-component system sensor histidine kinase KdpD
LLIVAEVVWAWMFNRVELDESYVYEHRFLKSTTREPIFARGLKRETRDLLELLILGAGDIEHRTKTGAKRFKNVPGASLGLGRAITEARSRSEAERLRDALLGSVSHELRTPLASILGAATTLAGSKTVRSDARLSSLATVVREEAERLNHDIQNLLDATRISSDGVRPNFEWSEIADIVNAAVERRRTRLQGRNLEVRLAPDLPLVYVDSVLIEQALGQVLDNAIKYSPPSGIIAVEGRRTHDDVTISVTDQGAGFSDAERTHAGERFFRGERHASTIAGAGLGLWIAKSFVSVNAGHLDIQSSGADAGAHVAIHLPVARETEEHLNAGAWSASDA